MSTARGVVTVSRSAHSAGSSFILPSSPPLIWEICSWGLHLHSVCIKASPRPLTPAHLSFWNSSSHRPCSSRPKKDWGGAGRGRSIIARLFPGGPVRLGTVAWSHSFSPKRGGFSLFFFFFFNDSWQEKWLNDWEEREMKNPYRDEEFSQVIQLF